jgi:hypothetical protein
VSFHSAFSQTASVRWLNQHVASQTSFQIKPSFSIGFDCLSIQRGERCVEFSRMRREFHASRALIETRRGANSFSGTLPELISSAGEEIGSVESSQLNCAVSGV